MSKLLSGRMLNFQAVPGGTQTFQTERPLLTFSLKEKHCDASRWISVFFPLH
jgi:hypothetical protein